MAKTTTLPITQNIKFAAYAITSSLGTATGESGTVVTNLGVLYTAPADDAIVKSLTFNSSDSSARIVNVYINNGTFDYLIGAVNVPAGSGITNGATSIIDFLANAYTSGLPLDSSGRPVLPLASGSVLKVGVQSSVTAAKTVTAVALIESYT